MKNIYETKFDGVIEWIDEKLFPGFYPLFDRRFKLRWRIANLILRDELRWLSITINNCCQISMESEHNSRRLVTKLVSLKYADDDISLKD